MFYSKAQSLYSANLGFSMGLGTSITGLEVGSASPVGVIWEMEIVNVYIGFASNLAAGKGEYLEFSSSQTSKSDKQSWYAINFGYNFPIKKGWSFLPKLGFIITQDIWQDPVGWDTYYKKTDKTVPQVGVDIRKTIDNMYFKVGIASTELASLSLGYVF